MVRLLCEAAEKQGLNVNLTSVFTFIGMVFSIVVSLVALVWLTCFVVRLLIKTFKKQVQNSYDIFVENSEAKTKSKKERNAIKRQAKDARKMELLNLKEESRDRIHKMKVENLQAKLLLAENKAEEKFVPEKKTYKKAEILKEIQRHESFEKSEKERAEKEKVKKETEKTEEAQETEE